MGNFCTATNLLGWGDKDANIAVKVSGDSGQIAPIGWVRDNYSGLGINLPNMD